MVSVESDVQIIRQIQWIIVIKIAKSRIGGKMIYLFFYLCQETEPSSRVSL